MTTATHEVDASGLPISTFTGRSAAMMDDERDDWAFEDREARVLIGAMLAFQIVLLSTMVLL